jgi:ectoine hydroxylase
MMDITHDLVEQFNQKGYLLLENRFSSEQVTELRNEIESISTLEGPEFFREHEGAIRTIFSPENRSEKLKKLISSDQLVGPLRKLFGEPFYLFQSKFNNKKSLQSGSWPWHQDFTFWQEDGMPAAKAITAAIYLTDITDISGPLLCVPGTHKHGRIETVLNNPDGVHDENLKYMITPQTLEKIIHQYGNIISTASKAGSVLYFHSDILHGSFQNMYYIDRMIMMFTYNPLSNKTMAVENPREAYMVKRDFTAI